MATASPDRFELYEMMKEAWGEPLAAAFIERVPRMDINDIATKQDVENSAILLRSEMVELRADLRGEMVELRGELRGEMAQLRAELRGEMAELRGELRGELAALRGELVGEFGRRRDTRWSPSLPPRCRSG